MKTSNYNFFYPFKQDKESLIAYNTLSGTLGLLSLDNYQKYLEFEKNNTPIDDEELLSNLKNGFFIIEDDIDEKNIIRYKMYAQKFRTDGLSITLCPTSDCNFNCIYCFEKNSINCTYMSDETIQNIIKYVESKADTINKLNVYWYGGEPLLGIHIIEKISESLLNICKDKNIRYFSKAISNGYNLTRKNIDILKKCHVTNMQITLDGNEETHNKRRPLKNGQATFDRIIKNLAEMKKEDNIIVDLRINADKSNVNEAKNLIKFITDNNLSKFIFPYLARVVNDNNVYNDDCLLSAEEYFNYIVDFKEFMLANGYSKNQIRIYDYPTRKSNICSCDMTASYVINADGSIYKCWEKVGMSEASLGNINDFDKLIMTPSYLSNMVFDPTLDNECGKCKYMPLCMGGCPIKRAINKQYTCDKAKYKLEETLNYMAESIISSQNS